jgi:hypothetical protein
MNRKNLTILIGVALVTGLVSIVLSGVIFGNSTTNSIKVPVVTKIDSSFPDAKNDTNYNYFFNSKAIDPTQIIKIGPSGNQQPFQGSSQ